MADVQPENGYTRIATELLEALAKQPLPPNSMMVFLTIVRKTYGFNKPKDDISLSQFCLATGLKRPEVCKAIRRLAKMTMIGRTATPKSTTYWIIKDFDKWTPLATQPQGVAKQPTTIGQTANQPVAKQPHTIDIFTKDTLTKDKRERGARTAELNELIKHFTTGWEDRFKAKYQFADGKDAQLLNRVLKTHGLELSKKLVTQYLDDKDKWVSDKGWKISIFPDQIPRYLTKGADNGRGQRFNKLGGVVPEPGKYDDFDK